MPTRESQEATTYYKTLVQSDVPQGRHGKHKRVISTILADLDCGVAVGDAVACSGRSGSGAIQFLIACESGRAACDHL